MDGKDQGPAQERLDQAEKRLAALADLGVDIAALRSQLAFARTRLAEDHPEEVPGICDEVLATARRLAAGEPAGENRVRSARFTRDQFAEELRSVLSQGMLAQLLAEQRQGPDPRLEGRLQAHGQDLRAALAEGLAEEARARSQLASDLNELREAQRTAREELQALDQARRQGQGELRQLLSDLRRERGHGGNGAAPAAAAPTAAAAASLDTAALAQALRAAVEAGAARQDQVIGGLERGLAQLGERLATAVDAMRQPPVAAASAALSAVVRQEPSSMRTRRVDPAGARTAQLPAPATGSLHLELPDTADVVAEDAGLGGMEDEPHDLGISAGGAPAAPAAASYMDQELLSLGGSPRPGAEADAVPAPSAATPATAQRATTVPAAPATAAAPAEDLVLSDEPSAAARAPVAATPLDALDLVGEPPVGEHQTTRSYHAASTRTEKPGAAGTESALRAAVAAAVAAQLAERLGDAAGLDEARVRALISEDAERRHATPPSGNRTAPGARGGGEAGQRIPDSEMRQILIRLLPEVLRDERVRQPLLALIALEAVGNPGALGELTGLRAFLRRELAIAAGELSHDSAGV
jgi:hypothetical protein